MFNRQGRVCPTLGSCYPEVYITIFSQELRHVEGGKLRADIDPCYRADSYELKLDEMVGAEPEPGVIGGLPVSDAPTLADHCLGLFTGM